MLVETSSIFAKLFAFVLLLILLSSNFSDGNDQKDTDDDTCMMRCDIAGDAHHIQLQFNRSHEKVTPIDLDDQYQNYVAIQNMTSHRLSILCTVLCALPSSAEATTVNETSTSYMSRHMYGTVRQIVSVIGNYQWLKPGTTVYEKSDRISDLDIVTFNLNRRNPRPSAGGIIQMAATFSFSAWKPLHYFTELSIAVPVRSIPGQFLNISQDEKNHKETRITGFWVDTFKEAATMIPFNITYSLVPFYGSDDELLKELSRKVKFAYPYSEVGPMPVMKEDLALNQVFSFMIPFTNKMWFTLAAITIFNAFVIWFLESTTSHESGGVPTRQVGLIFWFPLATLFYGGHRESPKNNLTYFVLAPWFILMLLVTSTYTATFTSIITSSETKSSCWLDIQILKQTNAIVGCNMEDSVMFQHLVEVLGFQTKSIKHIGPQSSIHDYAEALSTGSIKAAFFWDQHVGFFLAQYCEGFGGPNCNLRSSSVIIPRDSPFVHDFSEAMLGLRRSGSLKQRKDDMLYFQDCLISGTDGAIKRGIGPKPFSGLFILSGSVSAIAMLIAVIRVMRRRWKRFVQGMLIGRGLWVWLTTLFSLNQRENQLQVHLPRISSTSQTQVSSS